ncbi:MAG: flagellar protein FlgN [Planctomycetota bacterium]
MPTTQPPNPRTMKPTAKQSAAADALQHEQRLERLESTLRQSIERQRQLTELLKRKRDAMRAGDADRMTDLTRAENAQVQAISEIEKTRLTLVAELTQSVDPSAPEPLRLAELAERLPEPTRGKLLVLRSQLLEAMHAVQAQTAVAKRASESLVKHVSGLVRTLANVSHGHAAYGPIGRTPQQPAPMSTLSLTA